MEGHPGPVWSNRIRWRAFWPVAREEAKQILAQAEQKAKKLEKQLTAEEKKVNNPRALFSKIEELAKADSYFNCLDIIYYSSSIIDMAWAPIS